MENQTPLQCEPRFLSRSYLLARLRSFQERLVQSKQTLVALLPVETGRSVITSIQTLVKTYPVSNRTFFGAGLVFISFWVKDIFLLFDPSVGFPLSESVEAQLKAGIWPEGHWYYINWHWFLSQIDDALVPIVQILGAFFIVPPPKKYPPSYLLWVPIGYHIGTIIWLCFCKSPLEVNSNPPWTFAVMGVMLTIGLISCYQYLVHRYYHDFLRSVSALKSLIVHLPADMDIKLKEQAFDAEIKNFQSKF